MSKIVRDAHQSGMVRVIGLLRDAHHGAEVDNPEGHTGFSFPFDPAYAARLFTHHLNAEATCCLVYDVDGTAQGVLMAAAAEHNLSPTLIAKETIVWVDPAHRGRAIFQMLDAYEDWAKALGCAALSMAGKKHPTVAKLWERRGYRPAETYYLKAMQ